MIDKASVERVEMCKTERRYAAFIMAAGLAAALCLTAVVKSQNNHSGLIRFCERLSKAEVRR